MKLIKGHVCPSWESLIIKQKFTLSGFFSLKYTKNLGQQSTSRAASKHNHHKRNPTATGISAHGSHFGWKFAVTFAVLYCGSPGALRASYCVRHVPCNLLNHTCGQYMVMPMMPVCVFACAAIYPA